MKLRSTLLFAAASFAASALVPVVTTTSAAFFAASALSVPAQAATAVSGGSTYSQDMSDYASYTSSYSAIASLRTALETDYYFGGNLTGDIVIGTSSTTGLAITNANNAAYTLSGAISGSGVLGIYFGSGYGGSGLIFSGDMEDFSGTIYVNTISGAYYLTFSGTSTDAVSGTGSIYSTKIVNYAVSSGDVTVANSSIYAATLNFSGANYTVTGDVSGTTLTIASGSSVDFQGTVSGCSTITAAGDIALNGTQDLDLSGATVSLSGALEVGSGVSVDLSGASSATLNLTDVSIAGTVDVSGLDLSVSGDFIVSGSVDLTGATLTSTGDFIVSGSVDLSEATVTSTGSIVVESGGTLDLSSAEISVSATIENSGSVTVDSSTIFVLTSDMGDDDVYTIVSGGTITGWSDLTIANFTVDGYTLSGRSSVDVSTTGVVTISLVELIWAGTEDSSVWDTETTQNWLVSGESGLFYEGDNVTFDSTAESTTVKVESDVAASTVTVNADYTFDIATGASVTAGTLAGTGSLSVTGSGTFDADSIEIADGATLTLASGTLYAETIESTGTLVVSGGATLSFTTTTHAGLSATNISGAGTVEVAMSTTYANTLFVGDGSSFTGTTYVTSGYFTVTSSTAYGSTLELADGVEVQTSDSSATFSGNLVLDGTNLLHANANKHITFDETSSITGDTLNKRGRGTLTVAGTLDVETFLQTTGGGATVISGESANIGALTMSNGTFTISGDNATIGTATITTGTTTLSGTGTTIGTATISGGTNTISGDTTITALTLDATSASAVGIVTVSSGATLTTDVTQLTINSVEVTTTETTTDDDWNEETTETTTTYTGEIALEDDATLDLGSADSNSYSVNVTGAGDVYFTSTNTAYGSGVKLGSDFTGDFYYTGNYNPNQSSAGSGTLHLSDGTMWVGSGTLSNNVVFETDYTIGATGAAVIAFTGAVSAADGTTISVGTSSGSTTATFSGTVDADTVAVGSSGAVTFSDTTTIDTATVTGGSVSLAGTATLGSVTVEESGTLTVSGTAVVTDSLTLSSGTLTVEEGGSLDLSGATVSVDTAVTNSGTITVSTSTIFALTSALLESEDSTTYVVISGGTIDGWSSLTTDNFTIDGEVLGGRSTVTLSTDGTVSISLADSVSLVWTGATSSVWDTSTENWEDNATFYTGDDVTFDNSTDVTTVTIESSVTAGTVAVDSGDYTFEFSDGASVTASALTVADGASLTLSGSGTLSVDVAKLSIAETTDADSGVTTAAGTLTVGADSTLDLGAASAVYTILGIAGSGTINIANATSGFSVGLKAENFEGDLYYTGNYNPANSTLGDAGTLHLSAGDYGTMWVGTSAGAQTLAYDVVFESDYAIGSSSEAAGITFAGDVSTADGVTVTIGASATTAVVFTGTADFAALSIGEYGSVTVGGAGTLSVGLGDLTLTGTITVNEGATLDLGSEDLTGNVYTLSNISGAGTIVLTNSSAAYSGGIKLDDSFTGDVYITGNYNPVNNSVGSDATLHLSSGSVWYGSSAAAQTISADVVFETSYSLTSGGNTLTFAGAVSAAEGTTLTISTGTWTAVNFMSTAELDDVSFGYMGTAVFNGYATVGDMTFTGNTSGADFKSGGEIGDIELGGTGTNVTFSGDEGTTYTVGSITTTTGNDYTRSVTVDEGVTVSATSFTNAWGMGALTVNGELDISGTLQFSTGANASTSTNVISGTGTISAGTVVFQNYGTYNINGGIRLEIGSGGITQSTSSTNYTANLGDATIASTSDSWSSSLALVLADSDTGTTFETAEGTTITLSGVLSGEGALIKTGEGTLTLSGTNTYNGGTTVSEGTLEAASASALGAAGVSVASGATLSITADVTLSGTTTVAGTLEVDGGTLTVSSAALNISGATVVLDSAIENEGTITVSTSTIFELSSSLLSDDDSSTYVLINNSGSISGWSTLGASNFTVNGMALSSRTSISVDTEGAVTVVLSDSVFWAGTSGNSTWDTTSSNWIYDGETVAFETNDVVAFDDTAESKSVAVDGDISALMITVNSGDYTFTISDDGSLTTSSLTVADGATLTISGDVTTTALTVEDGATLTLSAGTLTTDTISTTGTGVIEEGATLVIGETFSGFSAENISGAGTVAISLSTTYANAIVIGSDSSFTGTTVVTSGYFTLNTSTFGSALELADGVNMQITAATTVDGDIIVDGTTQLHTNSSYVLTLNGSLTGAGTFDKRGGGTINISGSVDVGGYTQTVGTTTISSDDAKIGTLTVSGTYGYFTLSGDNAAITTATIATGTTTFSGSDATVGTLTVSAGTVKFTGDDATITTATLSGGTTTFSGDGLSIGTATLSGGTNTFSGTGTTFDTLTISGGTNTFAEDLTVETLSVAADTTFSGDLTVTDLTVADSSTLTVESSAEISGTATISGTLDVSAASLIVVDTASLDLSNGSILLYSAIENAGTVTVSTDTVIDLSADMVSGDSTVYVISGTGTIEGWSTLTAANFTIDGNAIGGHSSLEVSTDGVVVVSFVDLVWNGTSDNNEWTTDTSVTNWLNGETADYFAANDRVSFDSSAAYKTVRVESEVVAGAVTVSDEYTFNISSAGSLSATSITVSADASLRLKGAGTVEADKVTVATGATLDVSETTLTLGSAIANSGTVVVSADTFFNISDALLAEDSDNTYVIISNTGTGTIEGWDELSASNFALPESTSIIAEVDLSTDGAVTVGYYSGTVYTYTYDSSAGNTGDLAFAAYAVTTATTDGYSYGDIVTGVSGAWSDVTAIIATTSSTSDYNTLRFDSSVLSGTDSSSTTSATETAVFTFTPLAIAGVIVESGSTGFSISSSGTPTRTIYLGNATDTEAYSTINEDFTISNASSTNTATGFYIQGTQTWTIASGKTFTLETSDSGSGFTISGDLTITGGGTAEFIASSDESVLGAIASTADITISGATAVIENAAFTSTEGVITVTDSGTLDLSGTTAEIYGLALRSGEIVYTTEADVEDENADNATSITLTGGKFVLGNGVDTSFLEVVTFSTGTITEELGIGTGVDVDLTEYGVTTIDVETLSVSGTLGLAGTTVTVSGDDAAVTIGSKGELDLTGATYTSDATATGTGTIYVDSTTVIALTSGQIEEEGSSVYVVFSGDLTVDGWSDFTIDNFTVDGEALTGRSAVSKDSTDGYTVSVIASADLIWAGTSDNSTWVQNSTSQDDADLTKNWTNESVADAFYKQDNAIFDSSAAVTDVTVSGTISASSVSVTGTDYTFVFEDAATLTATTLTIDSDATLTLSGAGTLTVAADNLTLSGTLTVDGDAVLDLGSVSATYTAANIYGDGTIYISDSTNSHSVAVKLANFEGDIYYTGSLNPAQSTINSNATLHLSSLYSDTDSTLWAGAANGQTFGYNVIFETSYTIGDSTASAFVFSGDVSGATGVLVSVGVGNGTATVNFTGNVDFDGLTIGDNGVVNVYGGGTFNIGTLLTSTGTLTLGNVTVTTTGTLTGDITLSNTLDTDYTGTTFEVASGSTATISGAVSGTGTLIKTGDGTLVISGENSFSADTTVSAGTLEFNGTSEVSDATITIADGASLSFTAASEDEADETVVTNVTFAAEDGTTLTLYAGEYETVTFDDDVSLPDSVVFSGEGSGSYRGTFNFAEDNSISSLTLDGAGLSVEKRRELTVGDLTFTGSTAGSVSGDGTLKITGTVSASEMRANITIAELDFSSSSVEFTGTKTIYISSATITSDENTVLTKTSSGTLTFSDESGVESLQGSVVLKEGKLTLDDGVSLSSISSLTVAGGATLTADVSLSGDDVSLTLETGAIVSGTVTISGTSDSQASATIGGSDIGGLSTGSASVTTFNVSNTDLTFSGSLTVTNILYWGDGNTITLTSDFQNSLTGTTTLISFASTTLTSDDLDGLLQGVTSYGRRGLTLSLTSSALNVSIGGSLLWNSNVTDWETGAWSWVEGDSASGTTTWVDNDYVMFQDAGSVTVSGDSILTSGMVFALDGTFTINGDFALSSTNEELNGEVDAGITITSGDVVFSGEVTNTLEGGITISGGSLTVANGGAALGNGDIVLGALSSTTEAALKFSASGSTVTQQIYLANEYATIEVADGAAIVIENALARYETEDATASTGLTKAGAGTLTIQRDSEIDTLTVAAGTLVLAGSANSEIVAGTAVIDAGATLSIANGTTDGANTEISSITLGGDGATLSVANGAFRAETIAASGGTISGNLAVGSTGTTIEVSSGATLAFAGNISTYEDGGYVSLTGAGTLEIADGKTVSADVVQSAGTLSFAGTASIGGAYTTAGDATLVTANGGEISGTVTLGDGSSLTIENGDDATLTLSGGVTAGEEGSATVAISGGTVAVAGDTADFGAALTLTGTTLDVSAGTFATDALSLTSSTLSLAADTETAIGALAVDTAATLDLSSGATLSVGGTENTALSGTGTLTVVGSASGDSLAGTLAIDAGTAGATVDGLSIALDNAVLAVNVDDTAVLSIDSVSTVDGSTGEISKTGDGTLYLLSESTSADFDGEISLEAGTTIAVTRFTNADLVIESDATFAFLGNATTDATVRTSLASSLSGTGTLAIGGTLTVEGTNGGLLSGFTGTLAAAEIVSPTTGDTLGVGTIYANGSLSDWLANASGSSVALYGGVIVSEETTVEISSAVALDGSGTLEALTEDVKLTLSGGISGSGDLTVLGFAEIGDISGADITVAVSGYTVEVVVTDDDGETTTETQIVYGELVLSGAADGLDSVSSSYATVRVANTDALGDAAVSLAYSTLSLEADGTYENDISLAGTNTVIADGTSVSLAGTISASGTVTSSTRVTFTATNAGTLAVDGSVLGLGIAQTNFVADADSTVAVTVDDDRTLDAAEVSISGEGTFEKLGTGTVTVEGEIGAVATFSVAEGAVIFTSGSVLAGSDGAGTLSVSDGASVTLSGGSLDEMTLTGAGTVTVTADSSLAAIEDATDVTIESGTLDVAGNVSGSTIAFGDDAALELTGSDVLVSETTLSGSTVTIRNVSENNGAQTIDASVTFADDVETLVLYAQRNMTGGIVEAAFTGSIEKTGDGTWTLANYTYGSGATLTVTAGTLIWQNAAFEDDAEALTIADDATLRIEGLADDTSAFTGSIAGAGTLEIAYAGTEDNPLVLDIDVADGSTWALRITDDSNVQITCAVPGDLLVSGTGTTAEFVIDEDMGMTDRLRVSSGATLVKTGEGSLTLAHATEISGNRTQISGSTLDVQEGEVVQSADIIWDETSTLNIAADATFTVRIDDEDFLALIAKGTVDESVYTNSAALTGEGTLAIETTIGDGYTLSGAISDFAGTVTIASGATLNLGGREVLSSATVEIAEGGTLALTGTRVSDGAGTVAGLSGAGTLTVNATVSNSFAYANYSYDADSSSGFTGVINIFSGSLTFNVEDLETIGASVSAVNVGGTTTASYGEAKAAGMVSGGFLRVLNETGTVADATDYPSNFNFNETAGVIFAGESGFEVSGTLGTASTQVYVLEKDSSASGTPTLTLVGSSSSVDGSVFVASGSTLYVNAAESSVGSSSSASTLSVASTDTTTTSTGTNSISGDLTLNGTLIIRATDETIENDVLLDVAGTTEINPNGLSTKASIEIDVSDLSTDSDNVEFTIVSGYDGTASTLSETLEVTIAGEAATVSRDSSGNIVVVTSSNDYSPSSQLSSLYSVIKDSESSIWSVLSDIRADSASMEKSLIALSPVSFASLLEMQSGFAAIENDLLRERLEQRRYESAFAGDRNTKFKAFANIFGSTSESDGDGTDSANYDLTHYGIIGGFDVKISDNSIVGVSVAADWTEAELADSAGKHEGAGIRLGVYGMSTFENVFVGYGVSAGGTSFDTKRRSGYNNETLYGSTDGNDINATLLVGAGYVLSRDYGIDITPYVGVDLGYAMVDGFTEDGGSESALNVDDMDSTSLRGKIGATLSWRATDRLRISLDLSYAHEFLDTDTDIDAKFATGTLAGSAFSTEAYLRDENTIKVGPSIDFRLSDMWSISAAYAFETDLDDRTTHSGNIGARARF